jgi:hypothetical protein
MIGVGCVDAGAASRELGLPSFAPRVLAAARATPKQTLEKSALINDAHYQTWLGAFLQGLDPLG